MQRQTRTNESNRRIKKFKNNNMACQRNRTLAFPQSEMITKCKRVEVEAESWPTGQLSLSLLLPIYKIMYPSLKKKRGTDRWQSPVTPGNNPRIFHFTASRPRQFWGPSYSYGRRRHPREGGLAHRPNGKLTYTEVYKIYVV